MLSIPIVYTSEKRQNMLKEEKALLDEQYSMYMQGLISLEELQQASNRFYYFMGVLVEEQEGN